MKLLSDDDLDLEDMDDEELDRTWDLWFELAQETNDFDPPYTHGVFVNVRAVPPAGADHPPGCGGAPANG